MTFAVGSLVRARDRDWVVLPESDEDVVRVRPLGGTEAEIIGILPDLEPVEPATFAPPTLADRGDFRSARLLRDALRLGFRSSAGPFRSFGDLAVDPKAYQLVPLLMALRQETVRLLIADDVGIGKTIEAALIAKEMLTTGAATGLAVLCPPQLAEQWQRELSEKFHLEAELVLSSTAGRLEKGLHTGESLFHHHPITIVSLDFIKAAKRRDDFLRACPDLVIVDEAHTCADASEGRGQKHQRYQLLKGLAANPDRHLILVTATPHSGKEEAFRGLLALLDADLAHLPEDLSGEERRRDRERLAQYLVQRRRGDVRDFLGDTPFPDREVLEHTYKQSPEYVALLDDVMAYARESVSGGEGVQQRVRWWSALALLRALTSSPAAAESTLRTRAAAVSAEGAEEVDEVGRQQVMDLDDGDDAVEESPDTTPGADPSVSDSSTDPRLTEFAERAHALRGAPDTKLVQAVKHVKKLLADGFNPIVFCRFIDTAGYVSEELRDRLPDKITVETITGLLPPSEREDRIGQIPLDRQRVLVATDCLSEGINLQHTFDAVLHYDLPWNPTRLEQREGRVDRFGQDRDVVRVLTLAGDNWVDGVVMDVLLRKHRAIRKALGVAIPVPGSASDVMEALSSRLLGVEEERTEQVGLFDTGEFDAEWQRDADRERASRSIFNQAGIKVEEVAPEALAARTAIGGELDVEAFVRSATTEHGGLVIERPDGGVTIDLAETPLGLRDRIALPKNRIDAAFRLPAPTRTTYLSRTHPIVAGMANFLLDTTLDPAQRSLAARCGIIRVAEVDKRTTVVLARFRHQLIVSRRGRPDYPLLAESAEVLGFRGSPADPDWLDDDHVEALLLATPAGNVGDAQAADFLGEVFAELDRWRVPLNERAEVMAEELSESHRRVRQGSGATGRVTVVPSLPVDVLGVYVLLPEVKL
jgi:superfamily II DNA or RNA helicase